MKPTVPGPPKDVHVNVILNSASPGDFRIVPEPPGSLPTGPNGELIFENDHHSGFFVYFDLKDPNDLGYKFPPSNKMNDAVWSKLGENACPDTEVWDIFDPRSVINKGMTLKVRNTNVGSECGKFCYTLRVTKDSGVSYLPLDPGGDNKNGPIAPFMSPWIAPTVTGAVVGFGTAALVSNSFVAATGLMFAIGGAVVGLILGLLLDRR